MIQTIDDDRKKQLQQSLLEANTGCLLLFLLVLGLPFITTGLFFVYQGLISINAQLWLNSSVASVPATILSSEVRSTTINAGSGTGRPGASYWADIEFTYEYKGKTRKSDRVWPVTEEGREAEMRKVVERYPPDAQVTALVDCENPDLAFLEKRWSSIPYAFICVGSLPLVFFTALGIMMVGWKRPHAAFLFGLSIGMLVIVSVSITGGHYFRHVPVGEQSWWTWFLFAGTCAATLGLLVAIGKARYLGHQYREAMQSTLSLRDF